MFPANPHAARAAVRDLFGRVFVAILSKLPATSDPRERGRKAAQHAMEALLGAEIGVDQVLVHWLQETLAETPDDQLGATAERPQSLFGAPLELPDWERRLVLEHQRRARHRIDSTGASSAVDPKPKA